MNSNNMFKDKEIIVFDLDGTIVKLQANWHSLKDILSKRYSKMNSESCSFSSISSCLSKIVEKGDEQELKENFKIIRQYELENITDTELIPEIVDFIKNKEKFGISEEVRIVVFSLNTRQTVIESLKIAGISSFIDSIIGREDVRNWKPEPDGLIKLMQHYSVSPEKLIFFGDMKKDIEAGKAANVDSYYVNDLLLFLSSFNNKQS